LARRSSSDDGGSRTNAGLFYPLSDAVSTANHIFELHLRLLPCSKNTKGC
jgi:hypothetical protein